MRAATNPFLLERRTQRCHRPGPERLDGRSWCLLPALKISERSAADVSDRDDQNPAMTPSSDMKTAASSGIPMASSPADRRPGRDGRFNRWETIAKLIRASFRSGVSNRLADRRPGSVADGHEPAHFSWDRSK